MSDLTERLRAEQAITDQLRGLGKYRLLGEAADRIEQLEAALRDVGEMLADIDDPKTASGHCMFCGHRIGTSVFGVDLYIKSLHEPNCAWLTLRAPGDSDEADRNEGDTSHEFA